MTDLSGVSTADLQAYQSGDMSKVSTEGLMALRGVSAQPQQTAPSNPNFFQRVSQDWKDNAAAGQASDAAVSSGEISPLHYGFQTLGQGVVGDIAAPIKEAIGGAISMVPTTPDVRNTLAGLGQHVQAYLADKPNLARDLQSLGNVAAVVPAADAIAPIAGRTAVAIPRGIAEGAGNFASGIAARSGDQLEAATNGMYADAGKSYNQMRSIGATLNPQAANDLMNNINSAVNSKVFIPQLNPQTVGILSHLKTAIDTDGTIGLDQLDQYRRLLGRVPATEDGVSAGLARAAIDGEVNQLDGSDLLTGTPDAVTALNQGRKTFQQASKFDDIASLVQKANGDPNKLKAGLAKFMGDPSNTIGWSPDEIAAGKNAANTSVTEGLMKLGGKFGWDPGASNQGTAFAGVLAGLAGGAAYGTGVGAAIPIAGTIARQGQKWLGRGKAENLLQTIEGNVPPSLSSPISTAPKPILQLPAPETEYAADAHGNIRALSPEEKVTAQANRQAASDIGLTQDVSAVQYRNNLRAKVGPAWDQLAQSQQDKIASDVQNAWKLNPATPISELIASAKQSAEEFAAAKGETGGIGSFGAALLNAKK
jgi:hypothetical protein